MLTRFFPSGGHDGYVRRNNRRFILAVLVTAMLVAMCWPWPVRANATMAQFSFDSGVSSEDAEYVREGIRLAQDFFVEEIGAPISRDVFVEVMASASSEDPGTVAASMGRSILVYTGSAGWRQSAPWDRVRTIVHEYTHYYQYTMTGFGSEESPAWFEEGLAEYLSLRLLADLKVVSQPDIASYFASQLIWLPADQTLASIASFPAYQDMGAIAYPLSYFAVARLFEQQSETVAGDYYSLLAAGESFETAFLGTFGLTPAEFETQFAEWRVAIPTAAEMPEDIAVSSPVRQASTVRLVETPAMIVPGEQILVRALTLPASICTMSVSWKNGGVQMTRFTFADGTGDVFWLVTIPAEMLAEPVTVEVGCGGEPVTTETG